ncbi:MAG: 2Fe-2S iron-sulfur cluster-binding protein [Rhodospirillaceae bacterium]
MIKISVTLPDGAEQTVSAKPGDSVMAALREHGVPIRAECGGAMACATCHVRVDEAWIQRTGVAGDEEADLLDDSDYSDQTSRLSCQINCTSALDGLKVALQLDALED